MLSIRVNNEYLELERGEDIALTISVNELGSLDTRQGINSNNFNIPWTVNNLRILGINHHVGNIAGDVAPNKRIEGVILQHNQVVDKGFFQITDYKEEKSISLNFYAGNTNWFDKIKNKSLKDLDLSRFNHIWDEQSITTSIDHTTGYIYPLIDYGLFSNRQALKVELEEMLFSFYCHTIFTQIFTDVSISIEGTILSNPRFLNSIIPFTGQNITRSETTINNSKVEVRNNDTESFNDSQALLNDFIFYNISAPTYVIPQDGYYTVNYGFEILNSTNTDPSNIVFFDGLLFNNGSDVAGFALDNDNLDKPYNATSPTLFFNAGDVISLGLVVFWGAAGTITFDVINKFMSIELSEQSFVGEEVDIAANLPDISQTDFIKYFAVTYGLIFQYDELSSKLTINQFQDVNKNKPLAPDWTNKVDFVEELNFVEIVQNYGKTSYLKYLQDDSDEALKEYDNDNVLNFGSGFININNDFIDAEADIYEAPLAGTANKTSFVNGNQQIYLPQIQRYSKQDSTRDFILLSYDDNSGNARFRIEETSDIKEGDYVIFSDWSENDLNKKTQVLEVDTINISGDDFTIITVDFPFNGAIVSIPTGSALRLDNRELDNEPTPRILLISKQSLIDVSNNSVSELTIGTAQVTDIAFCYFAKESYNSVIDELDENLCFDVPNYQFPIGDSIISEFWQFYNPVLQNSRLLKANIRLRLPDISKLDFSKPIYIEKGKYTGYYYINRIEDYTGSKPSTKHYLVSVKGDSEVIPPVEQIGEYVPLPFPVDTNIIVVYDTTSFNAGQATTFKNDYVDRYLSELQTEYPNWEGNADQYSSGNATIPGVTPLASGQFGAFPERWVTWSDIGLNTGNTNTVVVCLIDESDSSYIFAPDSSDPVQYNTQPRPQYQTDYTDFVTNIYPNYDYFKGLVYAVPAGSSIGLYRLQHLHVYAAIEGTTVSEADFIPSYSGDISVIKSSNPYNALGSGLKDHGWQEKHDFPNGNITSVTYEEWENTMNNLLFGA